MLNVSKIHSLINKGENNASIVSRGTGINYRTLKSKIESNSWTANDIEILADFFKKPISYFFDREEKPYSDNDTLLVATEPGIKLFHCQECINKQNKLEQAEKERDDYRQKYIECLEDLAGKKKAVS